MLGPFAGFSFRKQNTKQQALRKPAHRSVDQAVRFVDEGFAIQIEHSAKSVC